MPYVERHLGTEVLPKSQMIGFLRANADDVFLHRWKLIGADKNIKKSNNCLQLTAAYKVRQSSSASSQSSSPSSLSDSRVRFVVGSSWGREIRNAWRLEQNVLYSVDLVWQYV